MIIKLWHRGGKNASTPFAAILLVALLVVLPQWFNHSLVVGVDALFHFNRFYEAAEQIKHNNYSYFQSIYGFQQTGRIVGALYGPGLTYIMGWLLLHLGSWFQFELVVGFLVEAIAGTGMYLLARRVGASRFWGTLLALVFMLAGWVPSWLTTQEFMGWGAALMPFTVMCGVRMVQNHGHPVAILPLALSMTVLIQTHVLSSVIVAAALVPFAVIGFVKAEHRARMVLDILAAAALTLLLTANVWGALLEVYRSNQILAPYTPLNSSTYTSKLSLGSYGRGTLGGALGLTCTVIFVAQIIATVITKRRYQLNLILTGMGATFLVMASPLLPWDTIVRYWAFAGNYLQFPSRLSAIAAVLLLAAAAQSLTQAEHWFHDHGSGGFQPLRLLRGGVVFLVVLVGYQTLTNVESSAEAWNKPKVLQSMTSVTLNAPDMQTIRQAFMSRNLGRPLRMVMKGTPDYLPTPAASVKWLNRNTQYNLYHQQTVLVTTTATAIEGQIGNKIDAAAYKRQAQLINESSPYVIYYDQIIAQNPRYTTIYYPTGTTFLTKVQPFLKRAGTGGQLQVTWTSAVPDVIQIPVVAYRHTRLWLNGKRLKRSAYARSDIGALIVPTVAGVNQLIMKYHVAKRTRMLFKVCKIAWVLTVIVMLSWGGLIGARRFQSGTTR